MPFRDQLDAAHARIAALERELAETRAGRDSYALRAADLETQLLTLKHHAERAAMEARHRLESETADLRTDLDIEIARLRAELELERQRVKSLEAVVAAQQNVIDAQRNQG